MIRESEAKARAIPLILSTTREKFALNDSPDLSEYIQKEGDGWELKYEALMLN